jgi:hypothetical protein
MIRRAATTALYFFATLCAAQTCPTWTGPWPGKLHGGSGSVRRDFPEPHCMSDAEIEQLIGLGRSYKTLDNLWESEFRGNAKFHWAWQQRIPDGNEVYLITPNTNTELRVLTDSWRIASGALLADHEMRTFTEADARALANPD